MLGSMSEFIYMNWTFFSIVGMVVTLFLAWFFLSMLIYGDTMKMLDLSLASIMKYLVSKKILAVEMEVLNPWIESESSYSFDQKYNVVCFDCVELGSFMQFYVASNGVMLLFFFVWMLSVFGFEVFVVAFVLELHSLKIFNFVWKEFVTTMYYGFQKDTVQVGFMSVKCLSKQMLKLSVVSSICKDKGHDSCVRLPTQLLFLSVVFVCMMFLLFMCVVVLFLYYYYQMV